MTPETWEYYGLPPHNRFWTRTEFAKAADRLRRHGLDDSTCLPRRDCQYSRLVFARLLNPVDMSDLPTEPSPEKRWRLAEHTEGFQRMVLDAYQDAFERRGVKDVDVVALMAVRLRTTVLVVKHAEEFRQSLDPHSPDRKKRWHYENTIKMLDLERCQNAEALADALALVQGIYVGTPVKIEGLTVITEVAPVLAPQGTHAMRQAFVRPVRAWAAEQSQTQLSVPLAKLLQAVEPTLTAPTPPILADAQAWNVTRQVPIVRELAAFLTGVVSAETANYHHNVKRDLGDAALDWEQLLYESDRLGPLSDDVKLRLQAELAELAAAVGLVEAEKARLAGLPFAAEISKRLARPRDQIYTTGRCSN